MVMRLVMAVPLHLLAELTEQGLWKNSATHFVELRESGCPSSECFTHS
jgi:hypothetical protein